MVSPLGNSCGEVWQSILSGQSGVGRLSRVPAEPLPTCIAGEARGFTGNISEFGELDKLTKRAIKKGLGLMSREIQMGVAAAQHALAEAAFAEDSSDPQRIGTMFGSDYIITEPFEFSRGMLNCLNEDREFEFEKWADNGLRQVEPKWLLKYLPNMPASHVAIYNDLRGPSNSLTVREASANLAIAEAFNIIRRGTADAMVTGSTGSRIHPLRTIHVAMQEQLAAGEGGPATACRPFDADRTGMVIGEGAGVMVLEDMEFAEARGAKVRGEVLGYGSSSVADKNGVPDYKTAIANVLMMALETSGLKAEEIGHVHAHGLSTVSCDAQEAIAIKQVLGEEIPVVAAKSYMGNLGAGSGIVELVTSMLAIENDALFPVLNFEKPDPNCPISVVTEKQSSGAPTVINVNVTPQGQASAIAVRCVS